MPLSRSRRPGSKADASSPGCKYLKRVTPATSPAPVSLRPTSQQTGGNGQEAPERWASLHFSCEWRERKNNRNCFHKPHLRHLPEKWKRRREKKIKATQRPHILLISWWKRLVYRLLFIECTCAGELQPFCSQRLLPSPGRGQWPRLLPALMEMDDGFTPLMRLTRGAVPLQSWAPKQADIFLRVSAFPKLSYISIENWKFREEH